MDTFLDINSVLITPEILNLIAEIDEFKGAWREFRGLTAERLTSLKKIATVESIGSSTRIEGSKLTDSQVELLLKNTALKSFNTRDEQEVGGYAYVCNQIYELFASIPFTENSIKQLHLSLLSYSNRDENHRGEYKKIPIRIEAISTDGKSLGTLFETTSPFETPFQMQNLVNWTNEALEKKELHPLIIIGIFTVLFLAIHPFQDGNGRLSRILTTLLMLKCGYLYAPFSSLESIIETNKESYYLTLQKTQKSWQNKLPDWNPWLTFFFNCLQRQKKHLEVKLERERMLQKHPALDQQIFELLKEHGPLKIGELEILTKANRNTLKKRLQKLAMESSISRIGEGKASCYHI